VICASAGTDQRRLGDFAPAIALLVVSVGAIFMAAFSPSGDRGQYAVLAPPWYSRAQTLKLAVTAGGDVVDVGNLQNVVIVHSGSPRFVAALYHSGAWLVVDPLELRGCLGFKPTPALKSGGV
jgi:hypothetical protein